MNKDAIVTQLRIHYWFSLSVSNRANIIPAQLLQEDMYRRGIRTALTVLLADGDVSDVIKYRTALEQATELLEAVR